MTALRSLAPVLGIAGALLLACRKDVAVELSAPAPTPLRLALPAWVIDSLALPPEPADDPLTVEGVELGRHLFHDPLLSDNGTMSCATCHVQANAFSDPRTFSVGTDGSVGTRNAMALVDLAWSDDLFWDGRRHTLEEQAHDPVTNPSEMRNTWPVVVQRLQEDPAYVDRFEAAFGTRIIDSTLVVKAIAQFERTLVSFGSRFDRYYYGGDTTALNAEERAGMALFTGAADCVVCHPFGLLTDDKLRNIGVDPAGSHDPGLGGITGIPADRGKFKVPTLRNIAVSAPYMHDGSLQTLMAVVEFYDELLPSTPGLDHDLGPMMQIDLTPQEKQQLVAFMNTFTDEAFLTDPAFGAP